MTEQPMPGAGVAGFPRVAARLDALRAQIAAVPRTTWLEVVALVAVTALALFLRTYDLTSLPDGLHGDEAVAGIEAQRILDQHGIGPYSPLAAGQPAGPLYLVAAAVALLGHTLLALRIVPALIGAATIPALYLVLKRLSDRPTALAAAAFLAVMGWHIHFARIGFPLETWPFVVLLGIAALATALSTGRVRWWAAAGAVNAAGIYVYNGQALVLALCLAAIVASWLMRRPSRRALLGPAAFAGTAFLIVLPMAWYAAQPQSHYFSHFQRDSITSGPEWPTLDGPLEQIQFVARRYQHTWARLTINPEVDYVDATGATPIIPPAMLALAALGMALAALRWRSHFTALALAAVFVMPLAPALTLDGIARRSFAMAPFLAIFCGIAVIESCRAAGRVHTTPAARRSLVAAAASLMLALSARVAYDNLHGYFVTFRDAPIQRWVFVTEYTKSVDYIAAQPPGAYIYYFSDRWSFDYEPRLYLTRQAHGEDRSQEFGSMSLDIEPPPGNERPVIMLLGRYRALLPQLEWMYPGGHATYAGNPYDPDFIAYTNWPQH